MNAGFVGHEDVRGCTGEKRGKLWSNIATLGMNPTSPSEVEITKEFLATRLGGGQLNMFMNKGSVG